MSVVDSSKGSTFSGVAARTALSCRAIWPGDRLISMILAVLAIFMLIGLLAPQAQAHDGGHVATGASAPGVEAAASVDDGAPSGDLVIVTADPDACDVHCCFSGLCCAAAALAPDVSLTRPRPAAVAAAPAVDLIAVGPPDGPRRPPKARI